MTISYIDAQFVACITHDNIDNAIPLIETIITKIVHHNVGFIAHRISYSNDSQFLWELDSSIMDDVSLSHHIESFLDLIETNQIEFNQLAKIGHFIIVCDYKQGYPDEGLFLSRETLLRLSKFPIDISFNLFE